MAKIYALLTKFTWGLYIFASILGLAKSWVKPHWVIIGAIILLFLTFPALAITDLTKQVEKLKKLVETPEQSNKIKDVIKPKSEVKTSEQPKKIKDVIKPKSEVKTSCSIMSSIMSLFTGTDVIKPKSEVKTSEQPKKIKDVIFQKNEYEIITGNRKTFAVIKDGYPDNLYCPHCFSQVNPTSNSCPKCNHNFEEDIVQNDVQDDVTPSEAQNNVESESNSGEVWVCSKCGQTNPAGTILCKRCGQ